MTEPRGLRNRNPGNIVVSGWTIRQSGYTGPEVEGRFATFSTMAHGLAALMRLLLVYRREHGLDTVRGIIDRWAPPAENDTGAYVQHVASLLMVSPDTSLPDAPDTYVALAKAIAIHENGPAAAQLAREDFALARSLVWPETQGPPVAVPERAPDASPAPAPAPIEDRSTIDPESRTEKRMLPAVAWALAQAAATAVPAVAKILFDPAKPVPQRNVEAAGAVLDKIVAATRPVDAAVWTEQQAVERVTTDAAAAAAAQAALLDDYDRLVGIIQRGVEADDASREKAAERATRERWDMLPFLADRAFRLIAAALSIEVGLLALGFVMHVSNEALMILLTLLVGTLNKLGDRWGQLYDYRIGSSEGSKASGEAVRAIATRGR